jgi:hypothetical protein
MLAFVHETLNSPHGGVSMFWDIFGFIVLVLFASASVGGIMIVRRMAEVVALRAKLEGTKTKRQIAEVDHALRIEEHKYGAQVLQLTAGADVEAPPEHVKGEVMPTPFVSAEVGEAYRLRQKAQDADFVPVQN